MTDYPLYAWLEALPAPRADEETDVLISRCLAGDEAAMVALYNQHAGMVFRLAYSLLQHQQDAEEVLQDSFEYALRRLDHFDHRKSAFTTWLYRITVSRCRNKRRRKWLPAVSMQQLVDQDAKDHDAPQGDDALLTNERQRAVWKALGALSPKLREVAILRYYGGLPYDEIGAILDIPAKTAESRMRLAHKALRDLLVDEIA
jgi:RNA polymerase sigma-70 factor (ECF subfamily)